MACESYSGCASDALGPSLDLGRWTLDLASHSLCISQRICKPVSEVILSASLIMITSVHIQFAISALTINTPQII